MSGFLLQATIYLAAAVIAVLRRRVETTERTDTDDTVE